MYGQKRYLSPILDLHNGYLVSYTIFEHPVLNMVTTMLEKAYQAIPDGTDLILHLDQDWQYQHKAYQRMRRKKGIRQRMSRKGNCLDNAVMENFFGLLKSELLYLQKFESMKHCKQELIDYPDYYNNRRIKAKRKGLPPALHKQQAPFYRLNNSPPKTLSDFRGSFHFRRRIFALSILSFTAYS